MRQILFFTLIYMQCFASVLDFDEVLNKTLQNDKNLKISDINTKIAKQEANKKFAEMFGSLHIAENYSNTNNPMYIFGDKLSSRQATFNDFGFGEFMQNQNNPNVVNIAPANLNQPGVLNNYETSVEYSVPLFTGLSQTNAHEAAKLDVKSKEMGYEWHKKTLSLATLKAYNQAIAAKAYVLAAQDAKKTADKLHDRLSAFYEQKLASKTDVLEAEYFSLQASAAEAKAKENLMLSISTLKYLSGESSLDGVANFPSIKEPTKTYSDIQGLLNNREDLVSNSLRANSANKAYSATKGNLSPSVNGFAKYMTNNSFPNLNNAYGSYFAGVGIKYKLFDGGKDSSEREQARLDMTKAALYAVKAKEDADLALEKAYLTMNTSRQIFLEKQKASELADTLDDKYQIMYENKMVPLYERLKKLSAKAEAKAQMIEAQAKFIDAIAEYRIYGGLDLMETK